MKYIYVVCVLALLGLLGWAGYVRSHSKIAGNTSGKLQVSASFYPLSFFASQIGGDKADVFTITPSGIEPHDFEPSSRDIARIESGDMLVLNGVVETWGDKIAQNLKGSDVLIVKAADGLFTNALDPHVWLDPVLAKQEVVAITKAYITKDPANATYYQQNQNMLDTKLDALDTSFREGLQQCQSRDIITSHAAFGYMAKRYGLRQIAIAGLSPDEEPTAQQLAKTAAFAKANHVSYIFFESLVSPKLAQTIAQEVGAQTLVLDPIEGLSDDDKAKGENYLTAMEHNLANLQIALSCTKNSTITP